MNSPEEELRIIADCVKAAMDINQLTKRAYKFLYLCNGFIAHYDKGGFMDYYQDPGSLKKDIFDYQKDNQYRNFRQGDDYYDYYMQKRKIYNSVCEGLINNITIKPKRKLDKTPEFDFGR